MAEWVLEPYTLAPETALQVTTPNGLSDPARHHTAFPHPLTDDCVSPLLHLLWPLLLPAFAPHAVLPITSPPAPSLGARLAGRLEMASSHGTSGVVPLPALTLALKSLIRNTIPLSDSLPI